MKQVLIIAMLLVGSNVFAQTQKVEVEVLSFGKQNTAKIYELEKQRQLIGDTINFYKKGLSKDQKDALAKDIKALKKCRFIRPCEADGHKVQ